MVHDLSDRSEVVFDDQRVVVNAGLVLAVTLGRRLGLEALVDAAVRLGSRPGASRPGRKVLSLVHAMLLGADCIDDCEILRAGGTQAILGDHTSRPSDWQAQPDAVPDAAHRVTLAAPPRSVARQLHSIVLSPFWQTQTAQRWRSRRPRPRRGSAPGHPEQQRGTPRARRRCTRRAARGRNRPQR